MITSANAVQQLVVDVEDASLLKSIKQAISMLKGVSSVTVNKPKVRMTQQEFFKKLDDSVASAKRGRTVRMLSNESGQEFLDRILCHTK
ncbi:MULTISPECIES: hypothetical protein [unclassified Fibrobacter]|uniref:hypothetical protein n=1 Tax=unclassified Fibrobacter TaxID=2634177 RepID=UPI0009212D30|nr:MULTISPECIES: hypothetical protein [unclassified Fibrobacter]OWV02506.1 hypothetical protein B7993_15265 [Fibrobacter sp. UWH3]SHK33582.1 hypothetical protein SAMN05720765_1023 [Fibrobacter sp. UWH6]